MSTRSRIGILNNDNTVTAIYCHFDGYLEHVGRMLGVYYNTPEKAKELIELGDLSALYPKLKPDNNTLHSFENPAKGVTIAYHRDRHESWDNTKPQTFSSKSSFTRCTDGSYWYLYDLKNQKWTYTQTGKRFHDLPAWIYNDEE